ncbi:hypothetical protein GF336_03650 [Candidatus Woesearchaeota archaeon]|nr:hypothetical protein [Candidatus Woesearchaeota archaeon]
MKQKLILPTILLILISLSVAVSAETLSIKGQPRDLNGNIESMHGLDVYDKTGAKLEGLGEINNDEGFFEIKNLPAPTGEMDTKTIWVMGDCIMHTFKIMKKGDQYVLTDAHEPDKTILTTSETDIDLGILKEDKPNKLTINSDDAVTMLIEDSDGERIAENVAYKKSQGSSGSLKPNTQYKLTLKTQKRGESWEKSFTTGNYCGTTRIIKRGDYFEIVNFQKGQDMSIGFWKKVKLFFKGLFS